MVIRKLQNDDKAKLELFLAGHAETSMFLRSNIQRSALEYQDKDYHGEYFGAFDEVGSVIGVLAHYWNGNIMMQAENEGTLKAIINVFRSVVIRPVAGVLGVDEQAKVVIEELSLSDEAYATNEPDGLFALNLDVLSVPASFDPSTAKIVELSEVDRVVLTAWVKAYNIEALGSEDNGLLDEHVENSVDRMINSKDCWALIVNGTPVSLSGFNAKLPDIVQIGPVWTPPEYRSRGYARLLVALTLQKAKEEGVSKAILFTDNPAAVKAYRSVGFEEVGSYRLALLKTPIDLNSQKLK